MRANAIERDAEENIEVMTVVATIVLKKNAIERRDEGNIAMTKN
jgi:hypothetical protein